MSKQEDTSSSAVQRPTTKDKKEWEEYWKAHGQGWRTEPEIESARQRELNACLEKCADLKEEEIIKEGKYPFKGIELSRSDIEWLLETYENGHGPVKWSDLSQREREGLDLRGANLQGVNLRGLPLARMRGGLTPEEWREHKIGPEERDIAAIHLEKAHLEGAHLEGAKLGRAYLGGANLFNAHLQQAILHGTHLEGTNFYGAHLEGTDLRRVFFDTTTVLERAALSSAESSVKVADVRWNSVNLVVVEWKQGKIGGRERREKYLVLGDESRLHDSKKVEAGIRLHYFNAAIRANNQLAIALRDQGLNDEAAYYAYRAQFLRRKALWWQALTGAVDTVDKPKNESEWEGKDVAPLRLLQKGQKLAAYAFSAFLALLSGYGYKPQRCFYGYVIVVVAFTLLHYIVGKGAIDLLTSFFMSIQAFHGRPFLSFSLRPGTTNPYLVLESIETIFGLLIEALIVAIFTQRILDK